MYCHTLSLLDAIALFVGLAQATLDAAHAGSDLIRHGVLWLSGSVGAATCRRRRYVLVVVGRMDAAVLGVVEVVQACRRGGAVVVGPACLVAAQVQPLHLDQVLLQADAGHVGGDPRRSPLVAHAGALLGGKDPLPGPGAVVVGVIRGRPGIAGQVAVLPDADGALAGLRVGRRGAIEIVLAHCGDVGWGLEIGRASCRERVCRYV